MALSLSLSLSCIYKCNTPTGHRGLDCPLGWGRNLIAARQGHIWTTFSYIIIVDVCLTDILLEWMYSFESKLMIILSRLTNMFIANLSTTLKSYDLRLQKHKKLAKCFDFAMEGFNHHLCRHVCLCVSVCNLWAVCLNLILSLSLSLSSRGSVYRFSKCGQTHLQSIFSTIAKQICDRNGFSAVLSKGFKWQYLLIFLLGTCV